MTEEEGRPDEVADQHGKTRAQSNVRTEFEWDANYLFFTVREPFPTQTTGASIVFGRVTKETPLMLQLLMAENGTIFSDRIEKDFLEFNSGTQAVVSRHATISVLYRTLGQLTG